MKLGQDQFRDDDDAGSAVMPAAALPAPLRPVYEGPLPTPPQKAFQPGSTPAHLMHRFLVGRQLTSLPVDAEGTVDNMRRGENVLQMWNSVGIVRGYNDEQDNAIDVEFHDSAVHHAMHLTNTLGHTMADVSQEAVLLACVGTEELARYVAPPSSLRHVSPWRCALQMMSRSQQTGYDRRVLRRGSEEQ